MMDLAASAPIRVLSPTAIRSRQLIESLLPLRIIVVGLEQQNHTRDERSSTDAGRNDGRGVVRFEGGRSRRVANRARHCRDRRRAFRLLAGSAPTRRRTPSPRVRSKIALRYRYRAGAGRFEEDDRRQRFGANAQAVDEDFGAFAVGRDLYRRHSRFHLGKCSFRLLERLFAFDGREVAKSKFQMFRRIAVAPELYFDLGQRRGHVVRLTDCPGVQE